MHKRNMHGVFAIHSRHSDPISPDPGVARFLYGVMYMATIAITTWNGIVSPVFDAAAMLLLAHDDGRRETVSLADRPLEAAIGVLQSKKVEFLICGAISKIPLALLQDSGISVVSWVRGPVEEVMAAFRGGHLNITSYCMPGYRGGCMNRARRARRRRKGCMGGRM
jgi:predicted Fe-Mo cluster-binding NifX family protein